MIFDIEPLIAYWDAGITLLGRCALYRAAAG
jgi:hypothetical protein